MEKQYNDVQSVLSFSLGAIKGRLAKETYSCDGDLFLVMTQFRKFISQVNNNYQ